MNVVFYETPEAVQESRKRLEPVFVEMLRRTPCDDFTVDDLFRMGGRGGVVLFAVFETDVVLAGAFEFRHYPKRMTVKIMALGGKRMREAACEFWPRFRTWCKAAGASHIEAECGEAMTRLLKDLDFVHAKNIVHQEL